MKKLCDWATVLALILLTVSCGVSKVSPVEESRYTDAILNRNFDLEILSIKPSGFPSKSTLGEYFLKVRGDVVDTRLPFIGSSSQPVFSGEEISIVLENEKVTFSEDFKKASKGKYVYTFEGPASNGSWVFTITLNSNGVAYINCSSPTRGIMNYSAEILIPEQI